MPGLPRGPARILPGWSRAGGNMMEAERLNLITAGLADLEAHRGELWRYL